MPLASDKLGGVMVIDFSTAAVIVTVVVPDTPASVAVIDPLPTPVPVTRPLLLTVAMELVADVQIADAVRSWAVRSEKMPVAVSCRELPTAMERLIGVTTIESSVAGVTVTEVVPVTPASVAVTVAPPVALPVTRPWLGAVLLTDATEGAEEAQVTNAVRFWVVPSEKSPVAISCSLVLLAIEILGGVMVIAVSTADVTVMVVVRLVEDDTPPWLAVIVVLPAPVAVTTPLLLTVATDGAEDVQLAVAVRS